MAKCNFAGTCHFLNEKMATMSVVVTGLITEKYCYGNFANCEIHKAATAEGIENVSKESTPDEKPELYNKARNWVTLGKYGW